MTVEETLESQATTIALAKRLPGNLRLEEDDHGKGSDRYEGVQREARAMVRLQEGREGLADS